MLPQAADYRAECDDLASVLASIDMTAWDTVTQFKGWTFRDIVGHLFMFDSAARLTVEDPPAFRRLLSDVQRALNEGATMVTYTREWLGDVTSAELLDRWRATSTGLADLYANLEPGHRVAWAGPDMSVKSCISARQMEVWAHGQAVYDATGRARVEADRIENVVVMGVNTFGWTFAVRGLPVPAARPHVRLTLPSGATRTWNSPDDANRIEGSAVEFCRVVTQTRSIADTNLIVVGEGACAWMSMAQCFAGPPESPPQAGTRFTALRV